MKNFKNISTTKRNNLRLFFQLSFFALFAIMSLFSGQTSAQRTCEPTTTVTEGDLSPGGIVSFGVSSGLGTVTVKHINAVTGLQSLTMVGAPVNAVVNMPAFDAGTQDPLALTFTTPNLAATDFTLRAASLFHAVFIRARCAAPPVQGCTRTQGYWKNRGADQWPVQSLTLGTVTYTKAELLSIFGRPVQGNGLISLSHQLIAAKLNAAGPTSVPASVVTAMDNADAMIGNRVVPPVGNGSLSTGLTSALTSILDAYNNGDASGGPPHCD